MTNIIVYYQYETPSQLPYILIVVYIILINQLYVLNLLQSDLVGFDSLQKQ